MEGTSIDEKKGAQGRDSIAVTLTRVRGRGGKWRGVSDSWPDGTEMKTEIYDSYWVLVYTQAQASCFMLWSW